MMQDLLQELTTLHPKAIDLSLDRMVLVLERLGNPHHHLPPVVHVAGTNGKGSTIAFLRAILTAAGQRVHVYTSPHLVRFQERIVLNGREITEDVLRPLLKEARTAAGDTPITFFEVTTLAAFLAFSRHPADVLILETGMGGRLDATNVVEKPLLTAITPIGFDHMNFLGKTLDKIAAEKAGIIKTGVPCLIGAQRDPDQVMPVFRDHAARVKAPLVEQGTDWQAWLRPDGVAGGMGFRDQDADWHLPLPALPGRHQIDNAGLALALARRVAQKLDFGLDAVIAAEGLQKTVWPGRLQKLSGQSLYPNFPENWECWLDGGHNEDGAHVLATQARAWKDQDGRPLDVVLGMLNTKQPEHFLTPLLPYIDRLVTVPIPDDPLGWNPLDLAEYGRLLGLATETAATVPLALQALKPAPEPGPRRVLICGSLHLVGAVLALMAP